MPAPWLGTHEPAGQDSEAKPQPDSSRLFSVFHWQVVRQRATWSAAWGRACWPQLAGRTQGGLAHLLPPGLAPRWGSGCLPGLPRDPRTLELGSGFHTGPKVGLGGRRGQYLAWAQEGLRQLQEWPRWVRHWVPGPDMASPLLFEMCSSTRQETWFQSAGITQGPWGSLQFLHPQERVVSGPALGHLLMADIRVNVWGKKEATCRECPLARVGFKADPAGPKPWVTVREPHPPTQRPPAWLVRATVGGPGQLGILQGWVPRDLESGAGRLLGSLQLRYSPRREALWNALWWLVRPTWPWRRNLMKLLQEKWWRTNSLQTL